MTLKYPCDNCFILPVCVAKHPLDILHDCRFITEYVMSQREFGLDTYIEMPFPIKELQEKLTLVITQPPNKEILLINFWETAGEPITGWRPLEYYKHGGKHGKGTLRYHYI